MSTVNDVCLLVCLFVCLFVLVFVILENFSTHIVHIRRPTILVLVGERLTVELSLPTYVCLGLDSNTQHSAFEVNILKHFSIAAVNIERNKKKYVFILKFIYSWHILLGELHYEIFWKTLYIVYIKKSALILITISNDHQLRM